MESIHWVFTVFLFIAYYFVYLQRVHLNFVIVYMVNNTSVRTGGNSTIAARPSTNTYSEGEFAWSETDQGMLLSGFFIGYIITQVAGGYLSDKYGGKHVVSICLLISSVCTALLPVLARTSKFAMLCGRIVIGMATGPVTPAFVSLFR